jgi:hypothetical protein
VPASRSTSYWAAVRSFRYSASVWVTANCVSDGDDIALAAQPLIATVESAVTPAAMRNRRLIISISPIPKADRQSNATSLMRRTAPGSSSKPWRHTSVSSPGRVAGIWAPLIRKNSGPESPMKAGTRSGGAPPGRVQLRTAAGCAQLANTFSRSSDTDPGCTVVTHSVCSGSSVGVNASYPSSRSPTRPWWQSLTP